MAGLAAIFADPATDIVLLGLAFSEQQGFAALAAVGGFEATLFSEIPSIACP